MNMPNPTESRQDMSPLDFTAVAFAGGGNRCYWQGGFWEALNVVRPQWPRVIVGVSAGAFQACFSVLGLGPQVRARVFDVCRAKPKALDWSHLRRGRSPLAVGGMYRTLIEETFGPPELIALKQAPEILIQISRPPPFMPGTLAALGAIGAYQIEKGLTTAAHSRAGTYLGLKPDWISTHEVETPSQLADALMASSSVPPFMPIGRIRNAPALDGGLVDNPPLRKLAQYEDPDEPSLVLATRNKAPPAKIGRRTAWPSRPLRVGKFAIDDADGICAAYELGLEDGARFARDLAAITDHWRRMRGAG